MTAAAAAVCPSLLWTMYLFIHIILPAQCIYADIPLIFQAQKNCWISMMSEGQVKYRQGRSAGFLKNKKTDFKLKKKKTWAHQFENSFLVRIRWSIFIHPVAYQLYTAHTWYYRSARTHASATIIYTQAISAAKIFMRRQEGRDFRCAYRVLFGPRREETHTHVHI
jgi:hypothetical protein